jgi:CRISPR/Cas system-associated protein endoribonuclease Cas2
MGNKSENSRKTMLNKKQSVRYRTDFIQTRYDNYQMSYVYMKISKGTEHANENSNARPKHEKHLVLEMPHQGNLLAHGDD